MRDVGHIATPVLDEVPTEQRRLVEESEGCLSVPGPYWVVPRLDRAVVRGRDENGKPLVIESRGYFARCLQHGQTTFTVTCIWTGLPSGDERQPSARWLRPRTSVARRAAPAKKLGK